MPKGYEKGYLSLNETLVSLRSLSLVNLLWIHTVVFCALIPSAFSIIQFASVNPVPFRCSVIRWAKIKKPAEMYFLRSEWPWLTAKVHLQLCFRGLGGMNGCVWVGRQWWLILLLINCLTFIATRSLSCHILHDFMISNFFFFYLKCEIQKSFFKEGFIYLFTLGCGGSSLVALSGISSPVVLCRLLLSVAPLVWEHSLQGP